MLKEKVALVLLASGKSTRYGKNKLLDEYKGIPMIEIALQKAVESKVERVILVTAYPAVEEIARKKCPSVEIVHNTSSEKGISQSLKLGLTAAKDTTGCVFMVCDQPELSVKTLHKMIGALQKGENFIYVCSDGKRRGNPAAFPKQYYPELLNITGDRGGQQVIKNHPDKVREIPVESETELLDIDYIEDKKQLEREV